MAAAVVNFSLMHRLHFKPEILLDIVSLASCFDIIDLSSSCEIDELSIYRTNAGVKQNAVVMRRRYNLVDEGVLVCHC